MQANSMIKVGLAGALILLLGSCEEGSGSRSGFAAQYAVARDALETGNYDRAKRSYARLMNDAGPLRPRLQLEYAHSELRDGNFAEAARLAGGLANSQKGTARSAALAVQGTAQHELAQQLLRDGETQAGKQMLLAAKTALEELLKNDPDLDPLGSMAGRKAAIDSRLKRL
ncbi:hypothetical protein [Thalassovita sp.]|uniref:tetratricopeptide repeat protein n=1 Tax=Thalassovita sp. TaxID=1979401 RepID=UPI002B271B07|nr:hypothetical protein [Thalassovita sp.]